MKLKRRHRIFCLYLAIILLCETIYPTAALALTGGPSQPEMQGFTPIGTSDMVDVFSGDFKYNIPLMDVGGYPLNLSYAAGQGMDAEASWVGLGWTLNPGVINRTSRGVPDDFKEDDIQKWFNMKPNLTYGIQGGVSIEFVELDFLSLDVSAGLTYNNYNGVGFSVSANPAISAGDANKGSMTFGLGLSAGSESGVGIQPSLSYSKTNDNEGSKDSKFNASVGLSYNSRAGVQELTVKADYKKGTVVDKPGKDRNGNDIMTKVFESGNSGTNGSTSISFSNPTFSPPSGKNYLNLSLSIQAKLGGDVFYSNPEGFITGSFSGQFLADKHQHNESYGYMYLQESNNDKNAMLDFNREKDGAVGQYTPNLPLAHLTYDIFSVSGQGIGGTYRPFRSDIGVVYDKGSGNLSGSVGADVGLEIAAGNLVKVGVNVSVNTSVSQNHKWTKHNSADDQLYFKKSTGDPLYEPYYFKQAGEKTAESDMTHFNSMGGFEPVYIGLNKNLSPSVSAKASWAYSSNASSPITNTVRTKRAKRNESINILTANEASHVGNIKEIENYPLNTFQLGTSGTYKNRYQPVITSRTAIRPDHHISEVTAFRNDGARYVYGIPAYNNMQDEVTFNVSGNGTSCSTGLANYGGSDDTQDNSKGVDNYFEKVRTPAYAHSYLLTEILSSDYVDVTSNGPTDDDLGNYTKINYTKVHDNYDWRVPYQANSANLNEGLLSDARDNKANYTYGEKEIWLMHSIETKNFIAEFTTSPRKDGVSANGLAGGLGGAWSYKLDKIVLYSKEDKVKEANSGGSYTAVPIKTVHLEYNYELCPNVHNNDGSSEMVTDANNNTVDLNTNHGKLTLKKLFFTYGNSNKGKLSPYEFKYADGNHDGTMDANLNPAYHMKGYDRWGNYKPTNGASFCFSELAASNNAEFPYVDQRKATGGQFNYLSDEYAWAWNLTDIKLPSGGQIKMEYEADDYAYVQDKKTMSMFKVVGAGSSGGDWSSSALSSDPTAQLFSNGSSPTINNYLFIELDEVFTGSVQDFRKKFLCDENGNTMDYLYFKFLLNIDRSNLNQISNEFVPGYCKVDVSSSGFIPGTNKGYIKIQNVPIQDKISNTPVNAISQAGWNYARIYASRVAYAKPDPTDAGIVQLFQAMFSTLNSIRSLITGMNTSLKQDGCSKKFNTNKSYIRLYHPTQFKKGGGYRVKKLRLVDNWQSLTDPNVSGTNKYKTAEYGQEYDYTTKDQYGNAISSGVAAYEPSVGGEENPWHQPVFFEEKHLLAANDEYFQERPYGESFFPSASVGYSKVTVKNLQYANVTRTATGRTVSEFYTAKDFPVIVNKTEVESYRHKPNPILKILKVGSKDFFTASQGYAIELNDMHGKPKAEWVYQEGKDEPISGVEHKYVQSAGNKIGNIVPVITQEGNIQNAQVGVDYDVTVDMRESKTQSFGCAVNGNLETALFGIIPLPVPMILPAFSNEKVRTDLAVVTKVFNKYGLVDKTIAYSEGAQVETKNTLYDAETGEIVSTETTNHFKDMVYTFNYPAHWRYEQMGAAYKNIGLVGTTTSSTTNYVEGDEVMVYDGTPYKAWVTSLSPFTLKKADGSPVNMAGNYKIKIIRSGRRNQQNVPIGNLTSKKRPFVQTGGSGYSATYNLDINQATGIIAASAIELTDNTKIFCECNINNGQAYNPYVVGLKGNWRQAKSYTYLTDRTQSKSNNNLNVREDGVFTTFSPFYNKPTSGSIWGVNTNNWTFVSDVTIFSPYGVELENKDALNRYSSADYGYNYSLPKAVASNAQYREIAFDGFEDYTFSNCGEDHFSFKNSAMTNSGVSTNTSHTGKRSIMVGTGQTVAVKKYIRDCNDCANLQVNFVANGNQVNAAPSGGIAPFTYVWVLTYNGQSYNSLGPVFNIPASVANSAYTLTLTVTDGQNCSKTISQTHAAN
ncbi:MAG: hypothetical protein Q8M29_18525 [Bacteroidota bacterium]|nr:hypothetical protein [Bacteroidota bacterium]